MISFITSTPTICMVSGQTFKSLNSLAFPSSVLVVNPPYRTQQHEVQELKWRQNRPLFNRFVLRLSSDSLVPRCSRWEGHGDSELEAEVLEFMKTSSKPEKFPRKTDLIEAGRMDLVKSIVRSGGWMSIGWDLDYQIGIDQDGHVANTTRQMALDERIENGAWSKESRTNSEGVVDSLFLGDSSPAASSTTGRSLEIETEDSAIHGILNRLERERKSSMGLDFLKDGSSNRASSNAVDGRTTSRFDDADSCYVDKSRLLTSLDHEKSHFSNSKTDYQRSLKPDTWKSWSLQRAGPLDITFEAAEIDFNKSRKESVDEKVAMTENDKEHPGKSTELNSLSKNLNHQEIRKRLQDLELELSSVLQLLRSNGSDLYQKDHERLANDLEKLSDASEFKETEVMNAHDKLRSLRAKLSVLEGKMALSVMDAQKLANEKQRRIKDARRAQQLLRSTVVVWLNPASEVLLTGSYDGWTTQRMMEKSSTGVFSVGLTLYPGKYEIKFIVDGVWRVDPLRPIVHDGEHENNVLLIH